MLPVDVTLVIPVRYVDATLAHQTVLFHLSRVTETLDRLIPTPASVYVDITEKFPIGNREPERSETVRIFGGVESPSRPTHEKYLTDLLLNRVNAHQTNRLPSISFQSE